VAIAKPSNVATSNVDVFIIF